MTRHIAIIQGHPDGGGGHLAHALAEAYTGGALEAGHQVRSIDVARLDFPLLRSKDEWESGVLPASLSAAQETLGWADHLVFIFPLWLGTAPALLKAFLEQVLRPGFAIGNSRNGKVWDKRLTGKSARLVVTMGMPGFVYNWIYGAAGVKNLERNILGFCGVHPVRHTFIGMVEAGDDRRREKWFRELTGLGRKGK